MIPAEGEPHEVSDFKFFRVYCACTFIHRLLADRTTAGA